MFFFWALSSLWLVFLKGPLRVSCRCSRHHSTRDGSQLWHEPWQHWLLPSKVRRRRLHHGCCHRVWHTFDKRSNSPGGSEPVGFDRWYFIPSHPGLDIHFRVCLTTVTWRSWRATWVLEVGSVCLTCQTPEPCTEGSAVAMVTWRMEKNVTVVKKRSVSAVCLQLCSVSIYISVSDRAPLSAPWFM